MVENRSENGSNGIVSRRAFLAATGTTGAGLLIGTDSTDAQGESTLSIDGSSTVHPITSRAGSVWNANPPADDTEYWGPGQYDIDTDERVADYFGGLYGFDGGEQGRSPFQVTVGLSHSGTGLERLRNGQVDVGDSSAPVSAEFPNASEAELSNFTDHVVGVDAQPIVVSREIHDAGVTRLTLDQVRGIYRGEITNWSEIDSYDGPDKRIQAVGRAEGSGTDTAFRLNVLGGPDAPMEGVDVRKGENQQVQTLVANSNNAIAYIALAFVAPDGDVPPVALEIEGTTYGYGKNLGSQDYPLNRDLHCYTRQGTSKKEAAFIRMMLSDYGQESFVASNDYVTLPRDRQLNQIRKLPEPANAPATPEPTRTGGGETTSDRATGIERSAPGRTDQEPRSFFLPPVMNSQNL